MTEYINILASLATLSSLSVALWRRYDPEARARLLQKLRSVWQRLLVVLGSRLSALAPAARRARAWTKEHPSTRRYGLATAAALAAAGVVVLILRVGGPGLSERKDDIAKLIDAGDTRSAELALVDAFKEFGRKPELVEISCRLRGAGDCPAELPDQAANLREIDAAKSCKKIKSAAHHAMDLGDKRALPALKRLQLRVDRNIFKKLCVGSAVDVAVNALER